MKKICTTSLRATPSEARGSEAISIIFLFITIFCLCGFTVSKDFKVIKAKTLEKINIPQWYHEGLHYDGKYMWINNGKLGNTWMIDISNGAVVKEIKPVATFTEGITQKDKDRYFVTDWDTMKVYAVHIENNVMAIDFEASTAPAHPTGVAWNGSNLFVITWTRGITGTKFHILKMDDKFNIISRAAIKNVTEPDQLTWDGKYLWLSCWYSKRVYKIDADKMELLGYFRSPVQRTTGIAWDGQYFWLTGTTGSLYKMEVQ